MEENPLHSVPRVGCSANNMPRMINAVILALIYAVFIIAGGLYLRGWLKHREIDKWPSVDAEIVGGGGSLVSIPGSGRYGGSNSNTMDTRYVEFEYSVDGRTYRSKTATPDGGGLPLYPGDEPWKAFYKPSSPEVAVLSPIPYQGIGFLVTALFMGTIVVVHLWFTVPELLEKQPEQGADGNAGKDNG